MSGWVYCHGPCIVCGHVFAYNPHHVPSTRALSRSGQREPVCGPCMTRINAKRAGLGHAHFPVHPQAYEPLPEEKLGDYCD